MNTCKRCNINKARAYDYCALCWAFCAHAAAMLTWGKITHDQYNEVLVGGRATVDFPGFPYGDPAHDGWADDAIFYGVAA
jgi:hypothetical protein